ncbi:protein MpC2H2-9 [Marchantia polymorpha subsp. ruderalis]|uniref:C2H2-type domain-containing protein n=2 Tax=Marchantia polymorpha TaxID=3197 RepID=A0AAF6BXQ1_MARPO|nr:hypothetical protein MARPO_0068s0079 [Marchantia polymorpha]BBN16785.1 hypothetical protein Mp_7g09260 [Marchantia polymorpha subsp. ruderalis]|eukprot:PTQ35868.1 hypothetical protein MARPO_0068s0079 [Marchantia polymorpha]
MSLAGLGGMPNYAKTEPVVSMDDEPKTVEKNLATCKVEDISVLESKVGHSSFGNEIDRTVEEKRTRICVESRGERRLQVKVDEGAASGESGPRSTGGGRERCRGCGVREEPRKNELCESCKQEGSGNFEGKVTRSSTRRRLGVQPVTPRLEEPRAVRANRGMKRRFPGAVSGDESDDNCDKRKRTRVRSISKVCGPNAQQQSGSETSGKGKEAIDKDWKPSVRGKRRGRQSEVFLCNVEGCEKSFVDAVALYNHGRVHGDRPYVCHWEGCTKRFSERSKLKRHFLIHTGEKPFICVYEGCGKAFSLDFNLRSHMKTHTGEYHECPHPGCEKRYCQEYKLRAHICKEHKGAGKSSDNGGRLAKEDSVISSNDKAAKKKERAEQLELRRAKLEKCKEGKRKRIQELEAELEGEMKELTKLDKALRKVTREQEEEEFEGCVEQDLLSDNAGEAELGEVYGEEKEVVMFAHKLPTADQGARLMNQVVLIQGPTPPLSPSISSSQPFLMSRVSTLDSTSPTESGLHSHHSTHLLPYSVTPICQLSMDSLFGDRRNSQNLVSFVGSQGLSMSKDRLGDPHGGGVSQAFSANCQSSISFIHGEQSSQCEPPVSQLFTYQEQPCLQD